jgi:hypothetical protein
MSLAAQIDHIAGELAAAKRHIESFEKGTKVSSTRARNSLQQVVKMAGVLKKEILAQSKAMPTKTRGAGKKDVAVPPAEGAPAEEDVASMPEEPPKLVKKPRRKKVTIKEEAEVAAEEAVVKKPRSRKAKQ